MENKVGLYRMLIDASCAISQNLSALAPLMGADVINSVRKSLREIIDAASLRLGDLYSELVSKDESCTRLGGTIEYRCAMGRPAPVYVLTYGLGKAPFGMYTQACRVIACMRVLLAQGVAKNVDMFHIQRIRLAKDSELLLESTDVSESFIRNVKSYGTSERV